MVTNRYQEPLQYQFPSLPCILGNLMAALKAEQ